MFGKSKRLGLVIILMAALVFMGIDFLKAKKPVPWEWDVLVPGAGTDSNLYAYNAFGNSVGNLFTDNGPIFVRVRKGKGGGEVTYSFRLWIGNVPRTHNQKIGFEGLDLKDNPNPEFEPTGNCPCSFPDYGPCPDVDPVEIPRCMQDFLVYNLHPYTDPDPDPDPDKDYKIFWLSIDVDCDIEGMNSGEANLEKPSGNVYIEINKTDSVLPEGDEDLHSIVVNRDVAEGSGIIEVTRVSDNSWYIIVDTTVDTENDTMRFTEAYWGYREKGKGRFETKKPIRAKAPFKFTTTWTRSKK